MFTSCTPTLCKTHACYRTLLASIRNLGRCPCPHCLIPLDRVPNMGTHRDMVQRISLERVDDLHRHNCIEVAREIIYMKIFKTDSKAVETLLQEDSLVPMAVGVPFFPTRLMLMFCCIAGRMHFLTSYRHSVSTCSTCSL